MLYGEVDNRLREGETGALAPLPASSLGERWGAAVDAQLKAYNLNSSLATKEQAFDTAIDGIFDLTGQRLDNPMRAPWIEVVDGIRVPRRSNPILDFESRIETLAREQPDKAREILSFGRVLEKAYATRNAAVARLEDVTQRSPYAVNIPGLGPVDPAAVAGGLYGSLGDPATLIVNALGAAGKGGTLLYHFVRSALINAGAEVVQQPFIKQWANEAGDPYGWDDAARGVAAAALLGGALDTTVRGAFRGVQRARGLEPVRTDGLITGWRSPAEKEAALDAAAARLPEDNPVRRLADGDVAAAREVAEATGAIEDPAVRGAIMAREMADDLEGPPPMAVDGGEGFMSLAQALRHASDPDEPPPAVLGSVNRNAEDKGAAVSRGPWDPEVLTWKPRAAIYLRGKYYVGQTHGIAVDNALRRLGYAEGRRSVFTDAQVDDLLDEVEDGFILNGRFLTRDETARAVGSPGDYIGSEHGSHLDRLETTPRSWWKLPLGRKVRDDDLIDVSEPRLASLPRDQRLSAAAEAIEGADQAATHGTLLGAPDAHASRSLGASAPARLDDVAGAEGKLQTDRLERDLATAIERATKPEKQPGAAAGDAPLSAADLAITEGRYVHSQAATLRMAEIRDGLARTAKMLPKTVRLRVVERLSLGGQELDGAWNYHDRIVYAALAAADPVHTSRHETIHALRQTGLMSDAEFDTLYRFAEEAGLRQAYGIDGEYAKLYRKLYGEHGDAYVEALLREEVIAEMFADYSSRGKRFGAEFGKAGRAVDKIIDVIERFLMEVRRMLKGYDVTNVRDVFEAIETGAMARRAERVTMPGGAEIEGFHLFAIRAFHGTPHTFAPEEGAPAGRFRSSQIGTGEGAQAYGHGLYFAESEGVARSYQTGLPYKKLRDDFRQALPDDAEFEELIELVGTGHFTPYQDRVLKALASDDWLGFDYPSQAISAAFSGRLAEWDPSPELVDAINSAGRLYEVRLNAEPEQFLDWDKPFNQQPSEVRAVLQSAGFLPHYEQLGEAAVWPTRADAELAAKRYFARPGSVLVERDGGFSWETPRPFGEAQKGELKNPRIVDALREAGIPGIRYLDGGSRKSGEGTSNFVIFPGNEHLIEIVAVDGQPVVNLAQDLADVKRETGIGKLVEACRL
jgi:hypothetical protein